MSSSSVVPGPLGRADASLLDEAEILRAGAGRVRSEAARHRKSPIGHEQPVGSTDQFLIPGFSHGDRQVAHMVGRGPHVSDTSNRGGTGALLVR
jgi:hypothetical protein